MPPPSNPLTPPATDAHADKNSSCPTIPPAKEHKKISRYSRLSRASFQIICTTLSIWPSLPTTGRSHRQTQFASNHTLKCIRQSCLPQPLQYTQRIATDSHHGPYKESRTQQMQQVRRQGKPQIEAHSATPNMHSSSSLSAQSHQHPESVRFAQKHMGSPQKEYEPHLACRFLRSMPTTASQDWKASHPIRSSL